MQESETTEIKWNDLSIGERTRLMPIFIEAQILHLRQAKEIAIEAHEIHIIKINKWIKNCERDLKTAREELTP